MLSCIPDRAMRRISILRPSIIGGYSDGGCTGEDPVYSTNGTPSVLYQQVGVPDPYTWMVHGRILDAWTKE